MILIGSKALQYYIPDLGRVVHDWDFMMSVDELNRFSLKYGKYLIKTVKDVTLYEIPELGVVEIFCMSGWMPSDYIMFETCTQKVYTPFGESLIPTLQDLYDIKKATAEFINEPKHHHDLNLILTQGARLKNTNLYKMRQAEIKFRIEKENKVKYDFFHKYHIPEYIKHDYLHEVVADLIGLSLPTYIKITTAETDIGEHLFNRLTHEEKISLMAEESLVLSLERWLIPQMVENGINSKLLEIFDNNNEGLPTYQILKHCCITGLKGEAEYITNFSRNNFFQIEALWIKYKKTIKDKGGFPQSFYNMLFKLRDEYKQGMKVGII